MNEQLFSADLLLSQHTDADQVLEVARRHLALSDLLVHQVGNTAVGLLEDDVHQFAAVDLGLLVPDVVAGMFCQPADGTDLGGGPLGGLFNSLQHEEYPRLPGAVSCYVQQEPVIVGLVGNDVAAEIKDGQAKQALLDMSLRTTHQQNVSISLENIDTSR